MHKYVINGFCFINSTGDREIFSASHLEDKTKKPEFYKFCLAEAYPNLEILTNLVGVKTRDNVDVFCRAHKFFGRSKLANLLKNNPCKDCVVQKKVALSNQKIIEELEEVRCKLPENISFDNQDALNAGIYGKPFLAKCSEHGVIETNRRLLKFSKYICKTCADIKCEHKNTVESKRKFLEYIENSNRDYDYSLVNFTNARKKVKIICKTHGVFLQTPYGHMKGYDCPKCGVSKALIKKVDLGYGNNFGRSSYTNLSGMSFVYVFKITSQDEEFYKIGITRDVDSRLKGIARDSSKYKCECIFKFHTDCTSAWDIEKVLHYDNREFKYKPSITFKGSTECFSIVDIESVNKLTLCCM